MTLRTDNPLALRLLAISAVCDFALLGGLGWYTWSASRADSSLLSHEFHALERMGAARQAGENRTNSAQMGVSTGNRYWRDRHRDFQSDWSSAWAELQRLAPAEFRAEAAQQLGQSERRLFQIEEQALDLARDGKSDQGADLLLSEAYEREQRTRSRNAEKIAGWLRDRLQTALDWRGRRSKLATLLLALALPIQMCLWMFTGRIGMAHIRQRRRTEELVRENEQRLNTLFEGIEDAVFVHDPKGQILDCNKAASRRLGYAREELLALQTSMIDAPEFAAGFAQRVANQMAKGVYSCEGVHVTRNGRRIPVDINTRVINYRGSPAILATIRDITERKRAEAELALMRELAEAASAAKSQFLANMSHEIRTPMNGIVGMTELALGTDLSAEQREYLQMVKLSADSLLRLINDILDFSKIDTGNMQLERIEFGLRGGLSDTIKALGVSAREKGLDLTLRVSPEVPETLLGDPLRLKQVIINLVGNAIKFTQKGHVQVTVEADTRQDEATLRFSIADTGIGIARNDLQAVFEPFRQADGSTTRKYGGTGLGLTISAQLAGLMGGKIWAESELGKGSVFHFTARMGIVTARNSAGAEFEPGAIAVDAGTASPPPGTLSAPAGATSSPMRRILVAEDNLVNQRLLLRMLEKRGHSVYMASNGREAVEAAAREKFDIALFDIQMPEMSGLEATAAIRARERQERDRLGLATHIPIIAITANAMQGDRERYLAAGMDDYIPKPVHQEELFEKVENMSIIRVSAPTISFEGALFDGDPEFLGEIVNLFLETYPQLLSAIEEAVSRRDASGLSRAAHTMKGAVANFGAKAVVEQARALELMGKNGDLSSVDAGWRSLRALMDQFVPELKSTLQRATEAQVIT